MPSRFDKLIPSRRPKSQRRAMVPFVGTDSTNIATNWFFGARVVEAQASASGASSSTAFQYEIGECTAFGSAAATAGPTRILQASAACTGIPAASGAVIRWSHVAVGTAAAWGQVFATATRQPLAGGTMAGRIIATSAGGIRQRNAIATTAGSTTALCNPWFVAAGTITAAAIASGTPTRLRYSTATGVGRAVANSATGVRVLLLTTETLTGSSTGRVDIWVCADGAVQGWATAVNGDPTGTWWAVGIGLGSVAIDGIPTSLQSALGEAAGASTATLDPTIHIEGAATDDAATVGSPIRMAFGAATSAGHATQSAVGRRVQYGRAPAWGAVLIGATGSWVKAVCGYAEGKGEAVAGTPDWRQTATAFSGCGSILSTIEEFASLIMTAGAEAAGSCQQALAIPDANIVVVEAAEPALADGQSDGIAAPDLIVWPGPFVCEQHAQTEAVPETVLDAQIVLAETPGLLAGDSQFAIAMAEASLSGWSLALAAANPIERLAGAQADGATMVKYQEPILILEPVLIGGFANVVAVACSSEWMEGRVSAWSGADAQIAACSQEAEATAHGDPVVRGLGGYALEANVRRTRGNCAIWARATTTAALLKNSEKNPLSTALHCHEHVTYL